jgi:hypothetical protein
MRNSRFAVLVAVALAMLMHTPAAKAETIEELAAEFWTWRAVYQPTGGDDIPRIERPQDWVPDWRPATVARIRKELAAFEARHQAIDTAGWPVARRNDYRLTGSAIARVRWELDHLAAWRRNPYFYIDQTITPFYEQLLPPLPFTKERVATLIRLASAIPGTLNAAVDNLDDIRGPFARTTAAALLNIRTQLAAVAKALSPHLAPEDAQKLSAALDSAGIELLHFGEWLGAPCDPLPEETAVGRAAYEFFLREVALYPFTPEDLLVMGRQEWNRSVAFEALEFGRNKALPELPIFPTIEAQIARANQDEIDIREFLEASDLASVPGWLKHYLYAPMPDYLAPISWLGVNTDQTSESRLNVDSTHYTVPPSPDLGYFWLSAAKDPRPLIVHEGVPGHYYQLAISWAHENPIRRRYYDSGPNEGIGFYVEEMMLQAGLFDNSPRSREIIYSYMRLRALRVEVDVKLALGAFNLEQAADYLEKVVPMDRQTAYQEAAFFAATPGQAITYQIGKLQIIDFLTKVRAAKGAAFSLREAHDFLIKNGNVPIDLLAAEYLAQE